MIVPCLAAVVLLSANTSIPEAVGEAQATVGSSIICFGVIFSDMSLPYRHAVPSVELQTSAVVAARPAPPIP